MKIKATFRIQTLILQWYERRRGTARRCKFLSLSPDRRRRLSKADILFAWSSNNPSITYGENREPRYQFNHPIDQVPFSFTNIKWGKIEIYIRGAGYNIKAF